MDICSLETDNCFDIDIGAIYNYFIKKSNIDTDVLRTKINIINESILSLSSASENFIEISKY